MPLLDHFQPPLEGRRHWSSFHSFWMVELAGHLNEHVLPPDYVAEAELNFNGRVEVDVATLRESTEPVGANGGGVATLAAPAWAPPTTALEIELVYPDEFEVRVLHLRGGPTLVAAIELVSPSNKDRPESRRAFIGKCLNYLSQGIGLIVVDVVTERPFNLHDELTDWMGQPAAVRFGPGVSLYAVAYRPFRRSDAGERAQLWQSPLALGQPLPTLPLALRNSVTVPVDLETAYMTACRRSRIP